MISVGSRPKVDARQAKQDGCLACDKMSFLDRHRQLPVWQKSIIGRRRKLTPTSACIVRGCFRLLQATSLLHFVLLCMKFHGRKEKQRTMSCPTEESIMHSCMRVDEQHLKNHLNPSSSSSLQTSQTPPRASKKKRKEAAAAAAALTIPHST